MILHSEDLPSLECRKVTMSQYMSLQRNHIERHKYFLSMKEGYDVGYDITLESWIKEGFAEAFRKCFTVISDDGQKVYSSYQEGYEK